MKKLIGIVVVTLILVSASCAMAHSPGTMTARYDSDTSLLWVEAPHSVSNPEKHYVESYKVYLNGNKYAELEVKGQKNKKESMAVFYIPNLTKGDKVKIETKCSQSGKSKVTLTI